MNTKKKRDGEALIEPHLREDEVVVWMGRPNPLWLFSPSDALLIPFSLMWGGFAIFWESGVLGGGAPTLFTLWGIPFVLIGQYMIWGRFVYKYVRRKHTYYALTDRRALVINTLFGTSLKSYFLHQFVSLHRQGQSVIFELSSTTRPRRNRQDWSGESQPGFYALPDADDAYGLLQDEIVPWEKRKNDER